MWLDPDRREETAILHLYCKFTLQFCIETAEGLPDNVSGAGCGADLGQVADNDQFALAQKLLCAKTANLLSLSEVARDLALSVNTVKRYLHLLVMTFQCFLLQPYYENVGKRLIKSPKVYFADTGLIRAILGDLSVGGAQYTKPGFLTN